MRRLGRFVIAFWCSSLLFALLASPTLAQETEKGEAAAAVFGIGGLICSLIFLLVALAVWIWVLVWVYRDATKRGAPAVVWVLVCWFLGIIGLIIYLVARPKEIVEEEKQTPSEQK